MKSPDAVPRTPEEDRPRLMALEAEIANSDRWMVIGREEGVSREVLVTGSLVKTALALAQRTVAAEAKLAAIETLCDMSSTSIVRVECVRRLLQEG